MTDRALQESYKPIIARSEWSGLPSSPASASVSSDNLTRNVRQLHHPKPLAQQSDVNTVGRGCRAMMTFGQKLQDMQDLVSWHVGMVCWRDCVGQ